MTHSVYARTRLAIAVAAQETADLARGVVGDVSVPMDPVERIRKARRVRLASLTLVDRVVLAALADGASWEQVAEGLGLREKDSETPAQVAEGRYGSTWAMWASGEMGDDDYGDVTVGLHGDSDPAGTAEALDQWWRRHAEPYETVESSPVTNALASDPEQRPQS